MIVLGDKGRGFNLRGVEKMDLGKQVRGCGYNNWKTTINWSGETTINRSDGVMMVTLRCVPGFGVENDGATEVEGQGVRYYA